MPTEAVEPRLVIDAGTYLGETPVWSREEEALYWINCEQDPRLSRWDASTGDRRDWALPERVGGFVLKKGGGALVVLASGVYDFEFSSGHLELRAPSPLPSHISLHECQCDRDGRLWVGSINHRLRSAPELPGGGKLFRLQNDALVGEVEDISCANGLAFSPGGGRIYLTDSPTRQIYQWEIDRVAGRLTSRAHFATIEDGAGFPDGATVDAEGCYWVTLVYHGSLRRYAPTGELLTELRLPFSNPTKLAFGGKDLRTIFLTTAQLVRKTGEPNRGAAMLGGVYALSVDVPGIPDSLFAG